MSNSIASAIANLLSSLASIGASLLNSILAVFQAVFALLQDVASSILQLAQAIIAFAADFFQGVIGFVAGKSSWLQGQTTTQAGHILQPISLASWWLEESTTGTPTAELLTADRGPVNLSFLAELFTAAPASPKDLVSHFRHCSVLCRY